MDKRNGTKVWVESLFVDLSFPVNEIGGNIDHVQDIVDAFVPPFK